jgi:phage terminase small subunit
MANGTSLKHQRFIDAYLGPAKGNGTEAARVAGYATPRQEAHRLLTNAAIRARIDERLLAESLSSAEVLAELTAIARAPWKNFIIERTDYKGEVIDSRLDLGDKVKALELLGKHHKLFTEKVEQSVSIDMGELTDDQLTALAAGKPLPPNPSGSGARTP